MSSYEEISPDSIEAAKTDEAAFIQLYEHYGQRVFRFLLARTGNVQLAEDLTQETFMTVLSKLHMYSNTGAKFSSWLLQIALNHARMYFRKHNTTETVEIDSIRELWPSAPNHHTEWMDFFLAVQKLPGDDATLLIMKFVEDMPNQDIADALQISTNTCGVQLHRALKRLQEYL